MNITILKQYFQQINFFYIITGFDTHSNVEQQLNGKFITINNSFKAFADEMKIMNVWNNVTVIQSSDFARTLNPNGGDGTDHAWGGNYIMMGKFFSIINLLKIRWS